MAQRARELRAAGRPVLDFSVGEPDQDTPAHIVAAGKAALDAGQTRYAPAAGLPELRHAVAEAYRRDFGVAFEPAEAVVTSGGKQALYLACQALFAAGDEVLIPGPYWPTFAEAVRLAGAKPVIVPLREAQGFRLSARVLSRAVTPRTRGLIVNSPSNPTGVSVAPEELLAIGRLARRRRLSLLYDDTYSWLQLEPRPHGLLQELRDAAGERLAILGTASKTHCMTGWRIGWLLAERRLGEAAASLI
jgi:aspartate/methionine/tyrosine aminotransferase